MHEFRPGQRWISSTELHMGLGTVMAVEHRTVTILFLATGETRTYAKQTAPLSRVNFTPGDTVLSHDGLQLHISEVKKSEGLITYVGSDPAGRPVSLEEGQLDNFIQLSRPSERLFTGQIDADKWFELRYRSLLEVNRLSHSELRGFNGCRTSLIPHQLYIAHEVANRYAPRVLLADEVGLGKTIEAGLILHQQLLTERARRVLVVVPETLVHQWLVEMLRRFNLFFSIFDAARCDAVEEGDALENPFFTEQLVLCDLQFLAAHPRRLEQACAGEWDLLVVDEAHHLQWSPQQTSPEYALIERLAAQTKGVLLLTATPEQLGKASHFARLRLLDPDRFPDFDAFLEEEKSYEPVASAVTGLLTSEPLDEATQQVLQATVSEGDNQVLLDTLKTTATDDPRNHAAREALIEHLLDRHGTGRVLFRNTRGSVKGFPARRVHPNPLPLPQPYLSCLAAMSNDEIPDPALLLCPERIYQSCTSGGPDWTDIDPRVDWLGECLTRLRPRKILVIAASARTTLELAAAIKLRFGIHAPVFHEGMSLVERDRAAAFFADRETGSQLLLCSEIGSEGRNFQFAHHMVLFDLPLNPDLLEQRIGRLDRIGQTEIINIHVPYLEGSAQALMFHWYQDGLGAFEHTCPAGHSVFSRVRNELLSMLQNPGLAQADLARLVQATGTVLHELNDALHRGRDVLLEYNSCRPLIANALKQQAEDEDEASTLDQYMESVFDCYGVYSEPHSEHCYVVRPGDHMLSPFPGLAEDGMTVTYDRQTALSFEDAHFLTWDHPMVTGAMDMVVSNELGNCALTAVRYSGAPAGTLMVECLYLLETASGGDLHSSRYLPATVIRVVIDEYGQSHDEQLSHAQIREFQTPVDADTAMRVVRAKETELRELLTRSEALAELQAPQLLAAANARAHRMLENEIDRLEALRQVNPNVRSEEIAFFTRQLQALTQALGSARVRLDALRVIIST